VGPALVTPNAIPSVPLIANSTRAELLVFIESKGKAGGQSTATLPGQAPNAYRNRY
jgi:hypothetical protein